MTTQYTPILKLALPVTGELSGTWGDVVNDNITSMVEQAIAGLATISTWTGNSHTLTTANGTTSESRCAMLVAQNGAGLAAAGEIVCPASSKLYVLKNDTSYAITLKTAAGTGVAVASGNTAFLFCDGTNVNACVTTIVDGRVTGNLTVDGNATVNGNTTLGNATSDTITATARFASGLLPSADNTYDLGSTANSWKDLYIDGTATMALVAISGGTINGVSIGATTPATFLAVDNLSLDGNTIASTNTNGNIVIAPNGTGDVQLDADTVRVGDSGAAATLTSNGAGALTVTTGGAADLTLSTNSGTTSGTIVIANGANGNITLTPDGTGDVILSADRVQIGDANTDTTLTTNGTGSLNLTTNNGTNSGTIQIAQGANGNITLTPNGTGSVSVPKLVWSNGTATRVPYLTTGGQFTDSANMVFSGTRLTVADFADSSLTSGRVTYATTGGNLTDSANMTFDGTTLTVNSLSVTTGVVFSGGNANQVVYLNGSKQATTSANLAFDGTTLTAANFADSSLTSGRVTYAGASGNLTDSASLTFNGTTLFSSNFWSSGDGNGLTLRNTANTGGGVITATTGTSGGIRISSDAGPMVLESGGATTLTLTNTQGATFAGAVTLSAGTANGVPYLNASKVLTTGTALSFDGIQQFGVGQRSTSWNTGYSLIQVGNSALVTASTYSYLMNNAYLDSSDQSRYLTTGTAAMYSFNRNEASHNWYTAASGSAGALIGSSFSTPKMRLAVNGDFMLNTTSQQAAISIGTNHASLIAIGNSGWANTLVLGTGYTAGPEDYTQLRVAGTASNSAQLLLTSANRVYVGDGYCTGDGQLNINRNGTALVPMLTFNNRTTGTSQYSTGAIAFQGIRDVRDPCYVGLIDVQRYSLSGGLNSQGHMRFFAGAEGKTYAEIVAQTANIYIDGYNGSVGINTNTPSSYSRFAVIGGTNQNQGTFYFGDGSTRSLNMLTNVTGGAYNSLTGGGDVLVYAGGQYQPMTIGTHDGGGIRFTIDATYIGAGSGGIRSVFANAGYQSTNGYVESKGNDSALTFNTINTSANAQQYYVVHDGSTSNIGNARGAIFVTSGSSGSNGLVLRQNNISVYQQNNVTRGTIKVERFTITSNTGGTSVTLSSSDRFTGFILVFGEGNDTSAYVFYVAGASSYDFETIGTLVSNGSGAAYTGNTSISLSSSLGANLTMTVTSSSSTTRTYQVFYYGAINN